MINRQLSTIKKNQKKNICMILKMNLGLKIKKISNLKPEYNILHINLNL